MMNSESEIFAKMRNHAPQALAPVGGRVEQGTFRAAETTHPCATFAPLHYAPGYAYPLIVWLHSPGQSETQLLRVMPLISLRNFAAAAPRGSVEFNREGTQKPGYYWSSDSFNETYETVFETLDFVRKKFRIAPHRICLAGCGDGGTMAQRLAFRDPTLCSSVISINGSVPEDGRMLEHMNELRKIRFLHCCSKNSNVCDGGTLYSNLSLLHSAGVPITLRKYTQAGNLQMEMLRDINRWLMMDIETTIM